MIVGMQNLIAIVSANHATSCCLLNTFHSLDQLLDATAVEFDVLYVTILLMLS